MAKLKRTLPVLSKMREQVRQRLRILDFDIENRPLSYLGADFTTAEVTAIAAGWVGDEKVYCSVLTTDPESGPRMLLAFKRLYDQADIVTGHYIRRHDLPIINGALLEHGLPLLSEKLTHDTKLDLVKRKELSMSQESLAAMYGLPEPKHHMSQPEWRKANRLSADGIEATKKRVISDVLQHKALRAKLIESGALKEPKMWRP